MKVLFTATVVKSHINTFHLPFLKMFKDEGWGTAVAARNDFEIPSDCVIPNCDTYFDITFERNPFNPKNIRAYRQLKKVIDKGNYDIIHCHTPVGGLLTRLAAVSARRRGTKVYYTAHGFHFYKGAPMKNWLLYYPVERLLAHLTDVLITINKEDYNRAKKFRAGKIVYVPGVGIDTAKFKASDDERREIRNKLRTELGIPLDAPVLLSVGEVNENKNHKIAIEALPQLDGVWYVICGRGPLMETHRKLAEKLGVSERLIMPGFRNDVADFYKMADAFVFPSFREGLPVSLMEALASGLPAVCTKIRGSADLVREGENGFYAPAEDPLGFATAIKTVLNAQVKRSLPGIYDVHSVQIRMKRIYGIGMVSR